MKKRYMAIIALVVIVILAAVAAIGFNTLNGISNSGLTGEIQDDGHYYIKATNADGSTIQNIDVKVVKYVDKKVISKDTLKTNNDGVIEGNFKINKPGTYSIKASYQTDNHKANLSLSKKVVD